MALRWLSAALVLGMAVAAGGKTPVKGAPSLAEPAGTPAPSVPALSEGQRLLDRAWRGGGDLRERSKATRAAALQLGIWSLDPAARAILHDASLGSAAERAEAAALLAPELPDASLSLARVRLAALDLGGAFDALIVSLVALRRHPEAASWFRATALDVAARSAIFGGCLFLFVAGLGTAGALALPLSVRLGVPAASAAAGLGALLLLPAAAGEGLLGVALACAALALTRGSVDTRAAVLIALLLMLAGLQPLAAGRDRALALLASDPLGAAVSSAERDFASPLDRLRLERAAPADAFARRALALQLRRDGDVAASDRRFRELLEAGDASAQLLNNAANTRFAAGSPDEALALYERAVKSSPSPLVLFNLAQSYGRAILLEEQDLALSQAQALDARAIHALTLHVTEVGAGGPVDVPITAEELRARAATLAPPPPAVPSLSRGLAPGRLGGSRLGAAACLLGAILLGAALVLPLRWLGAGDDLYAGLARLLKTGEATDPALRMARLAALRAREARLARLRRLAAWGVPGAAGLQAGRGLLGLAAALLAAVAVTAAWRRGGLLPDPLGAAETGAFVMGAAALVGALGYAALLGGGLVLIGRRR